MRPITHVARHEYMTRQGRHKLTDILYCIVFVAVPESVRLTLRHNPLKPPQSGAGVPMTTILFMDRGVLQKVGLAGWIKFELDTHGEMSPWGVWSSVTLRNRSEPFCLDGADQL
jgi:hypothetical protein